MTRKLLLGLLLICPPFAKKFLLRTVIGASIDQHAEIGWFSAVLGKHVTLGRYCKIRPMSLIFVDGDIQLGDYSEISSFSLIYGAGSVSVGRGSYVGPQCLINADEYVRIGDGSALGPRCMVFTHGSFLPYTEGYWVRLAGVTIGNKVWCAAGVFVHPGVEIGDDTFVNSRSVVTASVPAGSVVEGNPAKVVYPIAKLKRRMTPRRVDAAIRQMMQQFTELVLLREWGIDATQTSDGLHFCLGRYDYSVLLVPSSGETTPLPPVSTTDSATRTVLLNNAVGMDMPDEIPDEVLSFDFSTGQTCFNHDPVHTALRTFMLRYFGVRFTDSVTARES